MGALEGLLYVALFAVPIALPAVLTVVITRYRRRRWEELDAREQVGRLCDPKDQL